MARTHFYGLPAKAAREALPPPRAGVGNLASMQSWMTVAGAALLAAGCASSGPLGSEVLTTGSLKPDTARVVIYRTSAFGLAIQPDYHIDGQKVGSSQPNGFVVCNLAPGRHEVSVANMALNVNLFGGSDKATLDLRPGTTTYLHAQPQVGLTVGLVTLSEVSTTQGSTDTASLHKIESTCT
jgi:hypothetical protein